MKEFQCWLHECFSSHDRKLAAAASNDGKLLLSNHLGNFSLLGSRSQGNSIHVFKPALYTPAAKVFRYRHP